MAQKIQKTNVCRLLDAAGIAYELIEYAVDESDLSATHVAEQLGEDVDAVFKTIVLEGDKVKHFVCVVPGACEVDLKKAARASGNKSCKPIPQKELLPLTGYIRGGCSPIGMHGKADRASSRCKTKPFCHMQRICNFIAKWMGVMVLMVAALSLIVPASLAWIGTWVMHFAAFPLATIPGAVFSVWHNISGAIIARIYA